MSKNIILGVALVLTLAAALTAYAALTPTLAPTVAQAGGAAAPNAQTAGNGDVGIQVMGEGKVSVKPDIALANIGVEITTASLSEATSQANTKMTSVVDKLKSLGIAEKDIQTSGYNVYPITQQPPKAPESGGTPAITGYRVSNQVRVTVRKIADLGKILDAAIAAGANSIFGVSFGVDDLTPYQQQARAAAVKDAQNKAAQLAQAANVQLGPVVAVTENTSLPRPMFAASADQFGMGSAAAVPVQTGEIQVVVDVNMRYGIK